MFKSHLFNIHFLFAVSLNLLVLNPLAKLQCEWNGEKYDKNSSFQFRIGCEAIESFDLKGNEKVLDVGCGNGKITSLCASKLPAGSIVGLDSSPSMIDFAKEHHRHLSNLTFVCQDVTKMTFVQEFDFVYSLFCLHWVKDKQAAINHIGKSLKPEGKGVLYIPIENSFKKIFDDVFRELIQEEFWQPYHDYLPYNVYYAPLETWLKLAEENNLRAHAQIIVKKDVFQTYEEFKNWIQASAFGLNILNVMGKQIGNEFTDLYLGKVYNRLGLSTDQPIEWISDILILRLDLLRN